MKVIIAAAGTAGHINPGIAIANKIKQEQAKVEELKKLGYNIFERDPSNDMYKVENTTEYFLGKDNFLYLIYAYGNENYTSELDLVIF